MITRYLSYVLGAALAVFGIYHWLLFNDLNEKLRARQAQLTQQAQQIESLLTRQSELTKSLVEYRNLSEDQAKQLRALQLAHPDADKYSPLAPGEVCRSDKCTKRPAGHQASRELDRKCVALSRALELFIAQRPQLHEAEMAQAH